MPKKIQKYFILAGIISFLDFYIETRLKACYDKADLNHSGDIFIK